MNNFPTDITSDDIFMIEITIKFTTNMPTSYSYGPNTQRIDGAISEKSPNVVLCKPNDDGIEPTPFFIWPMDDAYLQIGGISLTSSNQLNSKTTFATIYGVVMNGGGLKIANDYINFSNYSDYLGNVYRLKRSV